MKKNLLIETSIPFWCSFWVGKFPRWESVTVTWLVTLRTL